MAAQARLQEVLPGTRYIIFDQDFPIQKIQRTTKVDFKTYKGTGQRGRQRPVKGGLTSFSIGGTFYPELGMHQIVQMEYWAHEGIELWFNWPRGTAGTPIAETCYVADVRSNAEEILESNDDRGAAQKATWSATFKVKGR